MKKIAVLSIIILVSLPSFSQNRKYVKSMKKAIVSLDEASHPESYIDCAESFENIAAKYEDQWIPLYDAALCLTLASLEEADGPTSDVYLDRARVSLDKALVLAPDESEIQVLLAFHTLANMAVDPEARGPMYFEEFSYTLEKARELNPDNPRTYYLQALLTLNMPDFMGGGPQAAKPIFIEADKKFKAFLKVDPLWPSWGEDLNLEELEKLN